MSIAYLFPGQGAQFVGMGLELYEADPEVRRIFDRASAALEYDVAGACFADPHDQINLTEYTQPLLLTVSYATFTAWKAANPAINPDFVAGLSLGEYTALVAAGSIAFEDAVRLARLRGRFMQEAVPKGVGTMAAVIGLDAEIVERLCADIRSEENWVEPANYNCPGQLVVSGHTKAVRALCQAAKAAGAAKAVPLPVSAPFHSTLLQPAGKQLAVVLDSVAVQDATVPVVTNVRGLPVVRADEIKKCLVEQVSRPVLFEQSLRYMMGQGVSSFVELGPGEALAKFARQVNPGISARNVNQPDHLAGVGF